MLLSNHTQIWTSVAHNVNNDLNDMSSFFKKHAVYIIFSILVSMSIIFRSKLKYFTGIDGIEVELIGALIIFLLIDIPLRRRFEKERRIEKEKAQVIIDAYLNDAKLGLFFIFFDYIFLQIQETPKDIYKIEYVEGILDDITFTDALNGYLVLPDKENISISTAGDNVRIIREHNLEKGFESCGYFYLMEKLGRGKYRKNVLSFEDLFHRLQLIIGQLEKFVDIYSKLLDVDQIRVLTDTVSSIKRIIRRYLSPYPKISHDNKDMAEFSYKSKLIGVIEELRDNIYLQYKRFSMLIKSTPKH